MDYADIRKHQHHLQDIKIGIERKIYAFLQFQQEKSEFSLQKKAVSQCETAAIFLYCIFIQNLYSHIWRNHPFCQT